jgi:ADP-ribosylglycohydrolase
MTTLAEAEKTARATHEHIEAIKGAVALAHAIFLGKKGFEVDHMRKVIAENYGYDLEKSVSEIQADPILEATTPKIMPLVFLSAFNAQSTENALLNSIKFGGPSGAIASMTGALAESLYGIPEHLKQDVLRRLPEKFLNVMAHFREIQANQLSTEHRGTHAA